MIDELTLLLKAKGIYVCPEQKRLCTDAVQEIVHHLGKMGHFSFILSGQYASNVAVVCALSKRIMAERGLEWDWEFDYDTNHYNIGFNSETRGGRRLFSMFWDYNKAHEQAKLGFQPLEMNVMENTW